MAGFVARQLSKEPLPKDLPALSTTVNHPQGAGAPDGAVFETDGGQRFKLRHARWVKVVPRKAKTKKAGSR